MGSISSKISHLIKTLLTSGKAHQSFIGAKWIRYIIKLSPREHRRRIALWILSISPHYFFRGIYNGKNVNYLDFLESEYKRNAESRKKILELILLPFLKKTDTVIDYGCGPGFLAKPVSNIVSQVFGVDVSDGALECAKIINPSPNITYMRINELEKIPDSSVDIIYSFAVIQHVTDDIFENIAANCFNKLKEGGTFICHFPINADGWRSEEEWRGDESIYGRIKWRYGLNCFGRPKEKVKDILKKSGFKTIETLDINKICGEWFDDICDEQLAVSKK